MVNNNSVGPFHINPDTSDHFIDNDDDLFGINEPTVNPSSEQKDFIPNQVFQNAKFFELSPGKPGSNTLEAQEFDAIEEPERARNLLAEERLLVDRQGETIASPGAAARTNTSNVIFRDKTGTVTHTTRPGELNVRAFTPNEMRALSGFLLAAFAAAEARKQLEEKKKAEEEAKKRAQQMLNGALRPNKHRVDAKQKKDANAPNAELKKNTAKLSLNPLNDTTNTNKRAKKQKESEEIEEYHELMIRNIKQDLLKKRIEKDLENQDFT